MSLFTVNVYTKIVKRTFRSLYNLLELIISSRIECYNYFARAVILVTTSLFYIIFIVIYNYVIELL